MHWHESYWGTCRARGPDSHILEALAIDHAARSAITRRLPADVPVGSYWDENGKLLCNFAAKKWMNYVYGSLYQLLKSDTEQRRCSSYRHQIREQSEKARISRAENK